MSAVRNEVLRLALKKPGVKKRRWKMVWTLKKWSTVRRKLFETFLEIIDWRIFLKLCDLLTVVSDQIARNFNRSEVTRVVALDISKAFDRVWHTGLLHKLKSHGISGQIFGLISSFLSNDLPDDVICENAIYADDTNLYSKWDQASDLWQ